MLSHFSKRKNSVKSIVQSSTGWGGTGASIDPYAASVVYLSHGESLTPEYGPTGTANGNAAVSTLQSKFGGSSFAFDGTGDYITLDGSSGFTFGTGDFTIEMWVYVTALGRDHVLYDSRSAATAGQIALSINTSNIVYVFHQSGNLIVGTTAVTANQWHHVAVSRVGTSMRLFLDGVQEGSTATDSTSWGVAASRPAIGAAGYTAGSGSTLGYIDEVRVTKGIGRYVSAFIPPTQASSIYVNTSATADPYWDKVTLLMHMDGANGSTVFTDQRNHAVTAAGNAVINSNKSKFGTSSTYFDGTGDYLTLDGSSDFAFGTGDFTIELWVYRAASGAFGLVDLRPTSTNGLYPTLFIDASNFVFFYQSTAVRIQGTTVVPLNTWAHVAVSRSGGVTRLFLNGVQEGSSYTDSNNYTVGASRPVIGTDGATLGSSPMNGYIDELRVTKGAARYVSNFTVPTAPFYDGYVDNGLSDANWSNVVYLAHMDGTAGSTTITDVKGGKTPANVYGNAALSATQKRFGSAALYFDGVGDYLSFAESTDFNLSGGDFTFEFWFYPEITTDQNIIAKWWSGTQWILQFRAGGSDSIANQHWRFYANNGTTAAVDFQEAGAATVTANQWYHIALSRVGSNYRFFRNGVQIGSTYTNASAITDTSDTFTIGQAQNTTSPYTKGYIDDLRITKGVGRYNGNFIPPSAPYYDQTSTTVVAVTTPDDPYWDNTTILMHMDGANGSTLFPDQRNHTITVAGDTKLNTTFSKFGASSAYFDGTGDYLATAALAEFDLGANDFTWECWFYVTSLAADRAIMCNWDGEAASTVDGLLVQLSASGYIDARYITGGGYPMAVSGTAGSVVINTWYHAAVTRSGSSWRLFLNGVQQGATQTYSVTQPSSCNFMHFGARYYNGGRDTYFLGYIDEVRVAKGVARYTTNFTVPTAPFYDGTNTSADPYWYKTVYLTHMDGADSSTTITDLRGKTTTAVGNAQLKVAQSRFGASSCYFDGAGDYMSLTEPTDFNFGTGDYTIELWVNHTTLKNYSGLIGMKGGSTSSTAINLYSFADGHLGCAVLGINEQLATAAGVVTTGAWYHLALTRLGTTVTIWVNGVSKATYTISAGQTCTLYGTTNVAGIGSTNGTGDLEGYIDEVRITKGIARYTANFAPQTTAFIGA